MKRQKHLLKVLAIAVYFVFIIISFMIGFTPGKRIGHNLISFSVEMLKILPCAFILIGLFEVWVKKKSVEKYLGHKSGFMGYVWSILLAGTTVGGVYVAFPVAVSLYHKGAKLGIIFTYMGASALCRIPMTIFEASFLGINFSFIRLVTSIPLVIFSSMWLGHYLEKKEYHIMKEK